MYAGSTQTLSTTITQSSAFVVASASVAITRPNGTAESVPPAVSISPGGSAVSQTLIALYVPTIGGLYTRVWTYAIGLQTYVITEYFWVTWTECYAMIRANIGLTTVTLPDTNLDEEFQSLVTEIVAMTGIPYYSLTGTDPKTFDNAMKWLASAELRTWSPKTGAVGEVIGFRKGTTYLQYAGRNENPKSPEELWHRKGWAILMSITSIAAVLELASQTHIAPTRGPVAHSNTLSTQGNAANTLFGGEMG